MSVLSRYLKRIKLTQEELKRILYYDPETGTFTWKVSCNNHIMAGSEAGYIGRRGYVDISIKEVVYKAHILAWFYMTGSWPKEEIDHLNRVRSDNRWSNLREATHMQNSQNANLRKNNTSGAQGVSWYMGKWVAEITISGKKKYLGRFGTVKEAKEAYNKAAREAFGPYYNEDL